MTNYLATIAARTINTAPPVRPRLRGRFDPPAWPLEGSLDQPVVNHTLRQRPRQNEIQSAASEEERDAARGPAAESVDGSKQHSSPSSDREKSEVVGLRTTVTQATDARPLSVSTFHAASDSIPLAQPTPEGTHVAKRSREPRTPVAAASPPAPPPIEVRTTNLTELQNQRETASGKSKTIEPSEKARALHSQGIISPATPRFDPEAPSHHPTSNSLRVIEREIKTVVVGDRAVQIDSQPSNRLDSPPRIADAIPDGKIAPREFRPTPVALQSRVEPLSAFSPESLSVHQSEQRVEPTVHVTIGRIEVRAVQQSSQPAAKPRPSQPVMNLDDYLRRRSQGSAR